MFYFDSPKNKQLFFQDPASDNMDRILELHNDVMSVLICIMIFVTVILSRCVFLFRQSNKNTIRFSFQHNTIIEQIWTIIPALVLLIIALPSCSLLYASDPISNPLLTVRILGYQWYWNYQYTDCLDVQFDSYMVQDEDLKKGSYRLLTVDNSLVLPINIPVRILTSSADVIHSWTVQSLGIKMDAVPGRNNQSFIKIARKGSFYGQCSELCGVNHAFMPIVVKGVSLEAFIKWIYVLNAASSL